MDSVISAKTPQSITLSPGAGRKVAFKTLGCRLNQYETDALATQFDLAGYQIVDFKDKADIVVVNTCTVTNQSDQKSRNLINQAARNNKGAVVVVTGCMANNHKEQLESDQKITYVVENNRKGNIRDLVDAHLKGEIIHPSDTSGDVFRYSAVDKSLHTRSAIKIQDGCDNYCTFCIIPTVRGRAVSRPLPQILENVKQTLDNGFRELVITGVNIGRYRWEDKTFEDVVEAILDIPGDFRVRISSLEPDGFGDRFYELFSHPKLAPHLHLCLQSGSDSVLLRMRRMYSLKTFASILERFRKVRPDFNFTTDMIVGFPGETVEDFQESMDAVKRFQFSHVHTFKYSVRQGTRAERMENQVPEKIKTSRSAAIRELSEKNQKKYYAKFVGQKERVLIEKIDKNGFATGYGEHYIPFRFKADGMKKNTFQTVRAIRVEGEGDKVRLFGEPE
ncbi:tRNA (N(6)-L-threonylcarbamoyladenosine(37)-C(2))-methylthiotransferase MtaB [Marinilabilia salmonicolor]|jgi:threonylcarbamoyladenosine tRNA methylthiotransferase MtaB|uniref:Threonylcarbamoyladenosine tRNA methylthiotransferase MtaB n=1 Tax=Marinilabilia salmonicolor TaxID=989 RepID=A0A368UPA9_9BACT|nr:tRNA (N(6)-L-threonylcarbamoyladenosine(37)-C(2))-methylthiotransferase MtaB [Marinilabilia salmonicolor]RCW30647.1 threonylcarbamoyladenosine tRNA methylthiotransferase MtaB [Marinilabilia salmonicolor]